MRGGEGFSTEPDPPSRGTGWDRVARERGYVCSSCALGDHGDCMGLHCLCKAEGHADAPPQEVIDAAKRTFERLRGQDQIGGKSDE